MDRDPLGLAAVDFTCTWVATSPGVSLRLLAWRPRAPGGRPILFIPGWVSAVDGWLELLRVLAADHTVYYLETREKASADLVSPKAEDFRIPAMASEVSRAAAAAGIDVCRAVVVGSSLGASILLEALKHNHLRPHAAFLIGPTCQFEFPWWAYLLLRLPARAYAIAKHLVLWYLRTFRVDAKTEPEQMRRYEQTLRLARPDRIKMSAQAVAGFSVWRDLATVETPVHVAYATSDTLHVAAEIERLIAGLPHATAVPCPSNRYMHSAALKPNLERALGEPVT